MKIVFSIFLSIFICVVFSAPQNPEINDQFQVNSTNSDPKIEVHSEVEKLNEVEKLEDIRVNDDTGNTIDDNLTSILRAENNTVLTVSEPQPTITVKFYNAITEPIVRFIKTPKVNVVMKNIGTCIVNGAMEIISYYFPAPLIPLIASAAGLVIPFEPVVMLREKMPVTSYRRAFQKAVKGFMGTFDRYKYEEEDPYMTRRFNRRFMGNSKEDGKKHETDVE